MTRFRLSFALVVLTFVGTFAADASAYYHPTVGRFIQRDPVGYRAGDANLYRYVKNRVTNAVDPAGLDITFTDMLAPLPYNVPFDTAQPPWMPEMRPKPEPVFFIGIMPIDAEDDPRGCRDALLMETLQVLALIGYHHLDVWSTEHGMIREGMYGPPGDHVDETDPRQPGEDDTALTRSYSSSRKLRWGKTCGKSCSQTTADDIADCLRSKPVPTNYGNNEPMEFGDPVNNCTTDVADAIAGCCLDGYSAARSSLPGREELDSWIRIGFSLATQVADSIEERFNVDPGF
ncbi:MAG: hypothetical protein HQ567_15825 [Candidatus Nealsonbacteria bacterium]|nr:hypothetical protein [Candidatus Nealsonbacteria bacterium]